MLTALEDRFPVLERLQDSFDSISAADVRALEADLQITFPTDYVGFLLEYNAAYAQHPIEFLVRSAGPFVSGGCLENSLEAAKKPGK